MAKKKRGVLMGVRVSCAYCEKEHEYDDLGYIYTEEYRGNIICEYMEHECPNCKRTFEVMI